MAEPRPLRAFIAVGSNIEPEQNVPRALRLLLERVRVEATSTFYRTRPLRHPEHPPFANGVWRVQTRLEPRPLKFDVLREVERRLGRVRTDDAYAPRTIDLDIAVYGDRTVREPDLLIPDPDVLERPFLAVPLLELEPDLRLPGADGPLREHPVIRRGAELEPMPDLTKLLKEMLHDERGTCCRVDKGTAG